MNAALGQNHTNIQSYSSTTPATSILVTNSSKSLTTNGDQPNSASSNQSSVNLSSQFVTSGASSQFVAPQQAQFLTYLPNPSQSNQMKGVGTGQQQDLALNLSRQPHQTTQMVNLNKAMQQAQQQQQQQPLLETLMHSVPNATSTPNPIQQQQQHINQDIFTNLFLKFDPTQFLVPKKDQLSFIFNNSTNAAQTGVGSVGGQNTVIQFVQPANQAGKPGQASTSHQTSFVQAQHPQAQFQIVQQSQQHSMQQPQLQQQQQIYIQQQQQIYHHQQQPQQAQFNGARVSMVQVASGLGSQSVSGIVSTNTTNIKTLNQQQQLDESSNSSDDANSTLGGNSHEKPYKCSQCFKLFRKKVHLNQHIRIHSGERPYGCDFCEKRFTQLSHLWQHTRRHTGERPYKCDIGTCDKSFTQLSNLQSHIRTHGSGAVSASAAAAAAAAAIASVSPSPNDVASTATTSANSPNKCGKCWKQFANKEELAVHMSTRHAGKAARNQLKRHYCEFCHKRFATEGVIRSHVCSKQPNATLVRNNEGSLIMRASNSSANPATGLNTAITLVNK